VRPEHVLRSMSGTLQRFWNRGGVRVYHELGDPDTADS